jgi:hypothetical protein
VSSLRGDRGGMPQRTLTESLLNLSQQRSGQCPPRTDIRRRINPRGRGLIQWRCSDRKRIEQRRKEKRSR